MALRTDSRRCRCGSHWWDVVIDRRTGCMLDSCARCGTVATFPNHWREPNQGMCFDSPIRGSWETYTLAQGFILRRRYSSPQEPT